MKPEFIQRQQYLEGLDIIEQNENYFTSIWDRVIDSGYKPSSLLDVGCGTGVFSIHAKNRTGCNISGIDGSTYAIEEAKKRGFEKVNVINDFSNDVLPYKDNIFDFVVCKDVLEHLLDPLHLIKECRRVLSDAGIFLLHVPNHFPLQGRLKFLINNDIDTFQFFTNATRWDFPHIRFFRHDEFVQVVLDEGFELIEDLSSFFPCVPLVNRIPGSHWLESRLAKRWPDQFSAGFTLLLKKTP